MPFNLDAANRVLREDYIPALRDQLARSLFFGEPLPSGPAAPYRGGLTVRELIAQLQALPEEQQDWVVWTEMDPSGWIGSVYAHGDDEQVWLQ